MKHVLKIEPDPIDFVILAIASAEKDYRLCHYINKVLSYNLSREEPFSLPFLANDEVFFNIYRSRELLTDLYFVSNKSKGNYLLPEVKLADYLFLFKGPEQEEKANETKQKLHALPFIQTIFAVEKSSIKTKNLYYLD